MTEILLEAIANYALAQQRGSTREVFPPGPIGFKEEFRIAPCSPSGSRASQPKVRAGTLGPELTPRWRLL